MIAEWLRHKCIVLFLLYDSRNKVATTFIAMTLKITAFSITKLSITGLFETLNIFSLSAVFFMLSVAFYLLMG
jgi:hypothetical protein